MMKPEIPEESQNSLKQLAEYITRGEELAYELRIEEVMTQDVKTFSPDMPMNVVLDTFRSERISGGPVIKNGKIAGIISIEDLIRCLLNNDLEAKIRNYMTKSPISVKRGDLIIEGLKLFVSTHLGRLLVINDDKTLAGILTKGDITRGILKKLQQDYEEEELIRYRASHLFEDIISERSSLILRYQIKQGNFDQGGTASSNIKRALLRLGASPQIARRCGIAVYEAEMNLIIHSTYGGVINVEIEPNQIYIEAIDTGPGIENIDEARLPGFSTANEKIRELGFGAGMGLVNIDRCVDWMQIESTPGIGTTVFMKIFMTRNSIHKEEL